MMKKLRSILKFGPLSTRNKDIFDIYYLTDKVDRSKLNLCFRTFIYDDVGMRENDIDAIVRRVKNTFDNRLYINNLGTSKKNWMDENLNKVLSGIVDFLKAQKDA